MQLTDVSLHRRQIGRFNASPQPRRGTVAAALERVGNHTASRMPRLAASHAVPTGAATALPKVRGRLQAALVLLAAASVIRGEAPAVVAAPVAAGGCSAGGALGALALAAAGHQVAAGALLAGGCMAGAAGATVAPAGATHALQGEALRLCHAVTRAARAHDFPSTFPAIAADVRRLEEIACDPHTPHNNQLAIARCLGRVHRALEKRVAVPLRRSIVRCEAATVSVDDALRVVRLAMSRGQLEAVTAMERLLSQAIQRANGAFLERMG